MVLVLLSASVERFSVSCMWDCCLCCKNFIMMLLFFGGGDDGGGNDDGFGGDG